MMFASRTIIATAALAVVSAFAQQAAGRLELPQPTLQDLPGEASPQLRRALLRASLKSQPAAVTAHDHPTRPVRQLSERERADLRQQLRSQ